jgi:hypothetical protein
MMALDDFTLPMIGHPAWGARQGYGSFLTFEFGDPKLTVQEWRSEQQGFRRQAHVQGRWHIWIYCCEWRVLIDGQPIAWSEDSRDDIFRATANLDGQKLTNISVFPAAGRSRFEFDLGGALETWAVGDDPTTEQWFIYGPDAVFAFRADGQYSLHPADTPPDMKRWKPLT